MAVASVYWQLMINVDFCVKENIKHLALQAPYNLNALKCQKNQISRYNSYCHIITKIRFDVLKINEYHTINKTYVYQIFKKCLLMIYHQTLILRKVWNYQLNVYSNTYFVRLRNAYILNPWIVQRHRHLVTFVLQSFSYFYFRTFLTT